MRARNKERPLVYAGDPIYWSDVANELREFEFAGGILIKAYLDYYNYRNYQLERQ